MILWAFSSSPIQFISPDGYSYYFSQYQAEDVWPVERAPVLQQVGGAAGAFDFFGDENYPLGPLTLGKRFTLKADTYGEITDLMDELRAATLAAGRDRLWARSRKPTGGHYWWTWAKCTDLRFGEVSGKNYLTLPVDLTFVSPEGLWYYSAYYPWGYGSGSFSGTNVGNYPALPRFEVAAGATNPSFAISGVCSVSWTGTTSGSGLVIDCAAYSVTNDGADAYDGLSPGSGQVAWFWIPPGEETVDVNVTAGVEWHAEWPNTNV